MTVVPEAAQPFHLGALQRYRVEHPREVELLSMIAIAKFREQVLKDFPVAFAGGTAI
jgi:hypothetical protein